MSRAAKRLLVAFVAGLATFLVLGFGQADRGDELIYGLVVALIAYWVAGKIFPAPRMEE